MILDTCALLGLAAGSKKLRGRWNIGLCPVRPVDILSAVCCFRFSGVQLRWAHRLKVYVPEPAKEWLAKIVAHHGLTVLPLEVDVCIAAAELPHIHNDPCDRFIIAAARLNNFAVVTNDERFGKYGVAVIN